MHLNNKERGVRVSHCEFFKRPRPDKINDNEQDCEQWLLKFFVGKEYEQWFFVNKNFKDLKNEAYTEKPSNTYINKKYPTILSTLAVMYPTQKIISKETLKETFIPLSDSYAKKLGGAINSKKIRADNFTAGNACSYHIKRKSITFFAHYQDQKYQFERFILLKALAFAYLKAIEHFSTSLSEQLSQLSLSENNILINRRGIANDPNQLTTIEYEDLDRPSKTKGLTLNTRELEKLYFEAVKFNASLYFRQPVEPQNAELPIIWQKLDEIFNVDTEQQELIDQMSLIHKVITDNEERRKNNLEKARQQTESERQKAEEKALKDKKNEQIKWQNKMQWWFFGFTVIQVLLAIVQTVLEKDSSILNWYAIGLIIFCIILIGWCIGTLFPEK